MEHLKLWPGERTGRYRLKLLPFCGFSDIEPEMVSSNSLGVELSADIDPGRELLNKLGFRLGLPALKQGRTPGIMV